MLLFTRAIRKTASSTLSAASQLIFAHKMALPSYLFVSRFSCEHEICLQTVRVNYNRKLHFNEDGLGAIVNSSRGIIAAYQQENAPFDEDFATVNPYLGSDGIKPFLKVCKEENKGIFVLVKTSNPSSGEFQDRLVDGRPLYEIVGEKVAEWGSECSRML